MTYAGDMTISPADPWLEIFRQHDGDGTIILSDGVYDAAGEIIRVGIGQKAIAPANLGSATVIGRWNLGPHNHVMLDGLDLKPPQSDMLMRLDSGWLELQDVVVDARDPALDIKTLVQTHGGVLRVTARERTNWWRIGPGIKSEVFDIDSDCGAKFVGNVTAHDVRMDFEPGVSTALKGIVLDNSGIMLAGYRCYGPDSMTGYGIDARRGSRLTIQDDNNRLQSLRYGIMARQASIGHVDGLTIRDCYRGIYRQGGAEVHRDSVSFSGNGRDVV